MSMKNGFWVWGAMVLAGMSATAGLLPVMPQPVSGRDGDEAYELKIAADGSPVITGEGRGRIWADVTYRQLKAMGAAKPGLVVKDGPKYRIRAVMLDVARKYFPMDFLRDLVRTMSWYKLNELHLHLNDNSAGGRAPGFRIACETFPGLTSADGSYTKAEFRDFVKWAATLGVNVVPEFDSPAHVGAFTRYDRSLASKKGENYFDLSSPKPLEFMRRLFAEYLGGDDPVFAGPDVSVGTDEYEGGDPELFRAYTDQMLEVVRSFGKRPRAWGALTQMAGRTPVNPKDTTLDIWNNGYYRPADAIRDGFDVICVPDNLVYLVPSAGYYYDWLDCRRLYNRWEPNDFDGWATDAANPKLAGGKFALWNDRGEDGCDLAGAWARLLPAMQTLGQKMWSGALPQQKWENFRALAWRLSDASADSRVERADKLYLVVDLDTMRMRELNSAPPTGWEQADFTERIVLRRVESTNGVFYAALAATTQAQYERITGDDPAMERGAERPVEHVNYNESEAFVRALNLKTGETGFALPTGAEWDALFAQRRHFRDLADGFSEWTSDLWNGNPEIRLMRDGDRKPRPSRGASRTGSLREGFRLIFRPAPRASGREFVLHGLEDVHGQKDGTLFTIRDEGECVSFRFEVKDDTVCTVKEPKVEFDLAYADRVEVYLCPTPRLEKGYLCVEIDAKGRPLDYHVTDDHKFLWDWNYRTLKCSGREVAGGYVVEGRIAKAELAEYGIDISRCWLGVFRADCPREHGSAAWYSALPMAPRPDFHRKGMVFPLSLK